MPELKHEQLLADYIPYYQYDNLQQSPSGSWQDPTPRQIGTLIHRILQRCTFSELQTSNWQQYRLHWSIELQALGVPAQSIEQATEKVMMTMEQVAADKSIHWLFANDHTHRKTEYPVTLATATGVKQYIIDLLIADGDTTWIIDYKTAQPEAHQTRQQFIEQELKKYHAIMYTYKKAVTLMNYKNIKLALYFPIISYFAEY